MCAISREKKNKVQKEKLRFNILWPQAKKEKSSASWRVYFDVIGCMAFKSSWKREREGGIKKKKESFGLGWVCCCCSFWVRWEGWLDGCRSIKESKPGKRRERRREPGWEGPEMPGWWSSTSKGGFILDESGRVILYTCSCSSWFLWGERDRTKQPSANVCVAQPFFLVRFHCVVRAQRPNKTKRGFLFFFYGMEDVIGWDFLFLFHTFFNFQLNEIMFNWMFK